MFDLHTHKHIAGWGIKPELFTLGNITIPSYTFFVLLGIFLGILVTYFYSKKNGKNGHMFEIVLAALIGGALGAKLPIWIYYFPKIITHINDKNIILMVLSGRTILGGLIGGTLGIWYVKRKLHIQERFGNIIVPGIITGISMGRVGCYLRGCCYGQPTELPWGVDFGDGIMRHPTQIYEIVFLIGMFILVNLKLRNNPKDGKVFDIFMISYFSYRFVIEFIRVEPKIFLHLTMYQWIALFVIIYFTLFKKMIFKLKH